MKKLPKTGIFVVVLVSYDYHRFQENLGAATSLSQAREIAAENSNHPVRGKLPIIEDPDESIALGEDETIHIWIERFPNREGK